MIETKEVSREIIKDQMMTFLDDITREITTLGEPRPVYVSTPKYLNLNDLDQNELQEYTAWIKVIVKDIKNNSDAKFDRVFGKNTFGNVKLRSVNSAFGLNPNFVPNLSQLELVGATQLNH